MKLLLGSFGIIKPMPIIPSPNRVRKSMQKSNISPSQAVYLLVDFRNFKALNKYERIRRKYALGIDEKSLVVIYFWNLRNIKGLVDLLHALAFLVNRDSQRRFTELLALDVPKKESAKNRRRDSFLKSLRIGNHIMGPVK